MSKKDSYPFQINQTYNEQMRCYELMVIIGGIKTKEELESFAAGLAEYIAGGDGTIKRVAFDA